MLEESIFNIDSILTFHQKALQWAAQFDEVAYLHSHDHQDQWSQFDCLIAVQASQQYQANQQHTLVDLQNFLALHPGTYIPGFLSYDLKNEIEDLQTKHPNRADFPLAYFFIPKIWLKIKGNQVRVRAQNPTEIFQEILACTVVDEPVNFKGTLQKRWTKAEYIQAFDQVQKHIQRGDVYEANLCQEFFATEAHINPLAVYKQLSRISPTPFSAFLKFDQHYILSASPERFLAKRNNKVISQPIKGTAKRGSTEEEDQEIIQKLLDSKKELAENVMIVDLVRNDLTRSAIPKTVKAERLFEIHSFKLVHQMISTITCEVDKNLAHLELIKNTFPAGSMTGAPKIAAMQICDEIEAAQRGVYAGAIGYFDPEGDFDFNVVIRTIIYNDHNHYLSFQTGGAITLQAEAESEYEECLLKAQGMLEALGIPSL